MARLTKEEVLRIVGRDAADDDLISDILATEASVEEFVEAYSLYERGDEVTIDRHQEPSPRVKALCDLLAQVCPEWGEDAASRRW